MSFKERILGLSGLEEADTPSFKDSPIGNPLDKDKPAPETGRVENVPETGEQRTQEPKSDIKDNFSSIINTTVGFRGDPDNKGDGRPKGMNPTRNDLAQSAHDTSTFTQRYNNSTNLQG